MRESRVRQRMLAALLVCAAAVLAASAPSVALGLGDLTSAQDQAAATRLAQRTAILAHDLADERDDVAALVAARKPGRPPAADGTRTDRQVQDVLSAGPADELRTALAALPAARRTAQGATADRQGVQAVLTAYQPLLDSLGRTARGPAAIALSRVTGAAAQQRGLLVAALTAGGGQPDLVAAAQAARLQERAALADFRAAADPGLRDRYDQTVTGSQAAQADKDTTALLDAPQLTGADTALGVKQVNSALTARIALLRSVQASAATDADAAAAHHRDHTVTVLELRVGLAALCLLLLAGTLVALSRSVTRPLAALHVWARSDAESGRGAEVVGQDEFAAVARRANALTHEAQALRARTSDLGSELTAQRGTTQNTRGALAGAVAEKDALRRAHDELVAHASGLDRELTAAAGREAAHMAHISLSLRTLGLVERQLSLIEGMEEQEQDPDQLAVLFKLDHLATRMRRTSETLLVLGGTEHSHGAAAAPVPLIDVARGAISEIEQYERVRIQMLPGARVAGRAADDVAHLIAELLDNATGFSDPQAEVVLSGQLLETGEVAVAVEDSGIGVPPERLDELNALLAAQDPAPPSAISGMGLYVVSRLALRHGVRVGLQPLPTGGTQAMVLLPGLLIRPVGPDEPPVTPLATPTAFTGGDPRRHPSPGQLPPYVPPQMQRQDFEPFGEHHGERTGAPHAPEGALPYAGGPFGAGDAPVPAEGTPGAQGAVPYAGERDPAHAGEHDNWRGAPTHPGTHSGPSPAHATPPPPPPAPTPLRPPTPAPAPQPLPSRPAPAAAAPVLPQRVPRAAGAVRPAPQQPAAPVDAGELRRRLDGLQRGLRAGRAEAVRERGQDGPQGHSDPSAGSVEEEATR